MAQSTQNETDNEYKIDLTVFINKFLLSVVGRRFTVDHIF